MQRRYISRDDSYTLSSLLRFMHANQMYKAVRAQLAADAAAGRASTCAYEDFDGWCSFGIGVFNLSTSSRCCFM